MDEVALIDAWRLRWDAKQLGVVLTKSACKDIDESTIIRATVDVWTGAAGMRVVRKFTDMLLAPPCSAMWTPWESARSHATFESTGELLMVTMGDCWRRLVLARDRQPYQALGHSQLEFSPCGSQYSGMIQSK